MHLIVTRIKGSGTRSIFESASDRYPISVLATISIQFNNFLSIIIELLHVYYSDEFCV